MDALGLDDYRSPRRFAMARGRLISARLELVNRVDQPVSGELDSI